MAAVGNSHKFKDWLLVEMNKRGWSQSDLARSADLNRAVINKLLSGQSTPRPATLTALARALRIPVEQVFRVCGILPDIPENEGHIEEVNYFYRRLQNPYRRSMVLTVVRALVAEEEQENGRK